MDSIDRDTSQQARQTGFFRKHARTLLLTLAIAILLVTLAFAAVSGSGDIVSPAQDNDLMSGLYDINVTFNGTANITIYWNNGTQNIINSSTNETGSYSYTFNTSTQVDATQFYNLSILLINSTNASDNETLWKYNLTVDNSYPNASLTTPSSWLRGVYAVNGTANDTTFQNYTIQIYNASAALVDFNSSTTAVENGTLYTWDTDNGTFSDGTYTVVLIVQDAVGYVNSSENFSVYVDNSPIAIEYFEDDNENVEYNVSIGFSISQPENVTLFVNVSNVTNPINVTLDHNNVCIGLADLQPLPYAGGGEYNITCAINKSVLAAINASNGTITFVATANDTREAVTSNFTVNWDFARPTPHFTWWQTMDWNHTTNTSQAITLFNSSSLIENPDIFFSPADNVINFSINVTDEGSGVANVSVNLSVLSMGTCTGILQLSQNGDLWEGNCSLGTFDDTSLSGHPNYDGMVVTTEGAATIMIYDNYGNAAESLWNSSDTGSQTTCASYEMGCLPLNVLLMVHDIGIPSFPGGSCERLGSGTTNMSAQSDWTNINMILDIEINLSCAENDSSLPATFIDAVLFNFSSLDFSSPSTGARLDGLADNIDVTVVPPNSFGDARIYVNSTYFSEFNTTTNITLYNLPFLIQPNVTGDPGAAGGITIHDWSAGPNAQFGGITTGNLTFSVGGFSGYNVSDTADPHITITLPVNDSNYTATGSIIYNVTVNGTGTGVSKALFLLNGQTIAEYNNLTGNNTANCTPQDVDGEVQVCYFSASTTNGSKQLNVTAWDYGGASPGNSNMSLVNFTVDTAAPILTVVEAPTANGYANNSYILNGTVSDATSGVANVSIYLNGTLNGTATIAGSVWNYTVTASDGQVHNITVNASDNAGNSVASTVLNVTVDGAFDTLTIDEPAANSTQTTSYTFNGTVNDTVSGISSVQVYVNGTLDGNATVTNGTWTYSVTGTHNTTHNLTVVATDNAGNSVNTSVTNISINDTTAPTITSSGPSGEQSSTSVTLTATTDEAATCRYSTTDEAYVNMSGTMTGSGTSHTKSLSLSAGNSYTYYVRCQDSANNTMNASETISFSTADDDDGGSGGGGGGSATTTTSNSLPYTPATVTLSTVGIYRFTIDGSEYEIRLDKLGSNDATFRFNTGKSVFMRVGDERNVDIRGDSEPDIYLNLDKVSSTSAVILIGRVRTLDDDDDTPATTSSDSTGGSTSTTTTDDTDADTASGAGEDTIDTAGNATGENATLGENEGEAESGASIWPWLILLVLICLVIFVYWAVKTERIQVE